ncbi:hypothetical protein [Streptomyces sp. NPDC090025]|uniref:hypothetical protein n=1 Tax=Streptomyces sp. NPDC090025 TaxID=3365922 RepID=UPI003834CB80
MPSQDPLLPLETFTATLATLSTVQSTWPTTLTPKPAEVYGRVARFANLLTGISEADINDLTGNLSTPEGKEAFRQVLGTFSEQAAANAAAAGPSGDEAATEAYKDARSALIECVMAWAVTATQFDEAGDRVVGFVDEATATQLRAALLTARAEAAELAKAATDYGSH